MDYGKDAGGKTGYGSTLGTPGTSPGIDRTHEGFKQVDRLQNATLRLVDRVNGLISAVLGPRPETGGTGGIKSGNGLLDQLAATSSHAAEAAEDAIAQLEQLTLQLPPR